jgi:hypothetical protein
MKVIPETHRVGPLYGTLHSQEWKGKLFSNLYMVRYIVKRVER